MCGHASVILEMGTGGTNAVGFYDLIHSSDSCRLASKLTLSPCTALTNVVNLGSDCESILILSSRLPVYNVF